MEELTGFGMKNSLTLPVLDFKHFKSLRDEDDEPIHTYTDALRRNFVRSSIEGSRCNSSNQYYVSQISDEVFNRFSKKLNVNGNIHDFLERYFELLTEDEKLYAKEFDSEY